MGMTPTLSGFAAGGAGCIGTAHFVNRSLCGATLSSFLSKFESQGFGFFDAAVQLFEQGRHLKWDLRSHRASARYRMAMFSRCPKQDMGFHTLPTSGIANRADVTTRCGSMPDIAPTRSGFDN